MVLLVIRRVRWLCDRETAAEVYNRLEGGEGVNWNFYNINQSRQWVALDNHKFENNIC